MSNFKYGCESYSWVMSGDKYIGDIPHLCKVISQAGLAGIETSLRMAARYGTDPALMGEVLKEYDLALVATSLGGSFGESPRLSEEERTAAEQVFDYISHFPEPRLSLSHYSRGRENLLIRQRNAMACYNEIGRMATECGIACALHPSSYPTSIFITDSDYRVMLDEMDPEAVKYCPDTGHIVNGGMDVYEIFATYMSIIGHVHMKDITEDKKWAPNGEGSIDFPRLMMMLDEANYEGWIVFEEESDAAREDPDAATLKNGRYLVETILPLGY
ncbi:MAG: TIM barrel protein [Gammaproteobacteria bacterium]|nr:TIM barrel protein [Gammaproteobacteria bacterium]